MITPVPEEPVPEEPVPEGGAPLTTEVESAILLLITLFERIYFFSMFFFSRF